MKKMFLLFVLALSVTQLWSIDEFVSLQQDKSGSVEDRNFRVPLIGEKAPSFKAESTNGVVNFPDDFGKSWKILFSHPADFTPVCSSEILELANLQSDFEKMGVKVAVVSTDLLDTHYQWKKAMEELNYKDRQPTKISFPLIGDASLAISKKYGMIHSESNTTKSVRGVFIIDPDNVIQAIYFYPMNVGRNTDELVRMLTALKTVSADKVMTPANWKAGNDVLIPFPPKADPASPNAIPDGYYNLAWFMWFKKAN